MSGHAYAFAVMAGIIIGQLIVVVWTLRAILDELRAQRWPVFNRRQL